MTTHPIRTRPSHRPACGPARARHLDRGRRPFASTLLADLGAEVLKVEMPGSGDALRRLAPHKDGVPLWWKVTNRNKKGITLDLRKPDGKALLGRLVAEA